MSFSSNSILTTFVAIGLKPYTEVDQPASLLMENKEVNDLLEDYFNSIVISCRYIQNSCLCKLLGTSCKLIILHREEKTSVEF